MRGSPFGWKAIQYGPEVGVLLTMLNAPFDCLIENSVTVEGDYEFTWACGPPIGMKIWSSLCVYAYGAWTAKI